VYSVLVGKKCLLCFMMVYDDKIYELPYLYFQVTKIMLFRGVVNEAREDLLNSHTRRLESSQWFLVIFEAQCWLV